MDTITHAVSGALIARATSGKQPDAIPLRARMLACAAAAAFPDSDFVMRAFDPLTYLSTHRGVTHSIVLLPLWSVVLGLLFAWIARHRYRWQAFAAVAALGLGIHIAGDVITVWGTMILAPLSGRRFAYATTFIIDPIFTAIIVAGLLAVWRLPARKWIAASALCLLAAYVGVQAWLKSQAIGLGAQYAALAQIPARSIEALPQPFSPLRWKILVETEDAWHEASVALLRREPPAAAPENAGLYARLTSTYRPKHALQWQRHPKYGDGDVRAIALAAWQDDALAPYRRFARFAVLDHIEDGPAHGTCVVFKDLRFILDGRPPIFSHGVCRPSAGSSWKLISQGVLYDTARSHTAS